MSTDGRQVGYNLTSVTGKSVRINVHLAKRDDFGEAKWQQLIVGTFELGAADGLHCLKCESPLMQMVFGDGFSFRADCGKCRTQHCISFLDGGAILEKRPFTCGQEKMVMKILEDHEPTTDPWHVPILAAERKMEWKDGTAEFTERVRKLIGKKRLRLESIVADGPNGVILHRWFGILYCPIHKDRSLNFHSEIRLSDTRLRYCGEQSSGGQFCEVVATDEYKLGVLYPPTSEVPAFFPFGGFVPTTTNELDRWVLTERERRGMA